MSWPSNTESVRVLDISRWVGDGENTPLIDFQELKEQNPLVKAIICRMAVGDYYVDPAFQHNYEEGQKAGFKMGIYYPLNPASEISSAKQFFRTTLGGRKPKVIVPDCEIIRDQPYPQIRNYTKDFIRWLRDSFGDFAAILNYTAAWFWNPIFGDSWGPEFDLWTAHYPTWWEVRENVYRQAKNFEEMEVLLPFQDTEERQIPIVPTAWQDHPDKVKAWQFSGKGELPPITGERPKAKETDLNLWKKSYFEEVFGPVEPNDRATVKIEFDPDKVALTVNGKPYEQ